MLQSTSWYLKMVSALRYIRMITILIRTFADADWNYALDKTVPLLEALIASYVSV